MWMRNVRVYQKHIRSYFNQILFDNCHLKRAHTELEPKLSREEEEEEEWMALV